MGKHFNHTNIQVLEEPKEARRIELEKVIGSSVRKVIGCTCQEPGCQRADIFIKGMLMDDETFSRLQEAVPGGKASESPTSSPSPASSKAPAPIIQTEKRMRCVL